MSESENPKILGPDLGYTDILDYEIIEKLKKEKEEKKPGVGSHPLRPSSSGYCGRRLAYELSEFRGHATYDRELLDPAVFRLFSLGHAIEYQSLQHFRLIPWLEQKYKQQILTFFEMPRGDESLPLEHCEGSCDGVFWSEKYKSICDVKSKKDKWSNSYKTGWDEEIAKFKEFDSLIQISDTAFYADDLPAFIEELDDDFLTDNLYQLNLYAMSDFMRKRGIDHAWLYRYNKNTSQHMEIRFRPSQAAFDHVKAKFQAINIAVDKKEPESVEKDYFLGSMRCAFCPFKSQCWDEDPLKEWFKTMPGKSWPKNISNLMRFDEATKLFETYEKLLESKEKLDFFHDALCELLHKEKVNKIRLSNGNIYELKHLKTPRPHYELRRSK